MKFVVSFIVCYVKGVHLCSVSLPTLESAVFREGAPVPVRGLFRITVPVETSFKDDKVISNVTYSPSDVMKRVLDQELITIDGGIVSNTLTGHYGSVQSLCPLNSNCICSVSFDGTLRVWNTTSLQCETTIDLQSNWLLSVSKLIDGSDRVCVGCYDGSVQVWDLTTQQLVTRLDGHSGSVRDVKQLSDGRLVSTSTDLEMKVWDLKSQQCVATLDGHTKWVKSVIELSDGRLCSGSEDQTIKIWSNNESKWSCVGSLEAQTAISSICEILPGVICAPSSFSTIGVWDLASMKKIKELDEHTGTISSLIRLKDGTLCSASGDLTLRIWDVNTGDCLAVLQGHTDHVFSVVQLPDGRLCSGSYDNTIRIWDPFTERRVEWSQGAWKVKVPSPTAHCSKLDLP